MIRSLLLLIATLQPADSPEIRASEAREKGRIALTEGSLDDALKHLSEAVQADPTDVDSWLLLARAYSEKADQLPVQTQEEWDAVDALFGEAERCLRTALESDADTARTGRAWTALGEVLLKRGNASEAIDTLYYALRYDPENLRLLSNLGDALLMARSWALDDERFGDADTRLAEARTVLEKAAALGQVQADVLRALGEVQDASGEPAEALRSLRKAIALRPDDLTLHNAHLAAVRASKEFDQGLSFYAGLVDAPALAKWYRAETLELKGNFAFQNQKAFAAAATDYQQAEQELLASAEQNAEYAASARQRIPYLRSYRGYALTDAGKLDEAETAFFSALDRDPGMEHAVQGLARLMTARFEAAGGEKATKEKFDEIRAFASRVTMVHPDSAALWNNYGFFAREAGKYEESYQAYRRAIALEPDNPRYLNDTALILVYHLGRDLDLAEQWLLEARDVADMAIGEATSPAAQQAMTETFGDSLVNLITLYYAQRRVDEARGIFDRLEELLPDRGEIRGWERRLYPERVAERRRAAEEAAASASEVPPPNISSKDSSTDG